MKEYGGMDEKFQTTAVYGVHPPTHSCGRHLKWIYLKHFCI